MQYEIESYEENDDGTMPENVKMLSDNIVGRRIVKAEQRKISSERKWQNWLDTTLVITLDNGKEFAMSDTNDCCASTELKEFWLDPESVNHVITGVGTTETFTTWHIYCELKDIMRLEVYWTPGNPFYYGYGFEMRMLN